MLDSAGTYGEELEALTAAYERDNEGLSYKQFFEKHASEGYKRFTRETIEEVKSAWEQGVAI